MGKTKTVVVSGLPEKTKKSVKKKKQKKSLKKEKGIKISGLKGGERVVAVEAEMSTEKKDEGQKKEAKKQREPKVRGKKYQEAKAKVDPNKLYSITEAVKLVKKTSYSSFNGAVELHLTVKKIGISANLKLPFPSGKEKKIEIADDKTIEKLKKGKIDFDLLLATADIMPKLVPFAKMLGPKGLMPNPKAGTIIKDKKEAKKFSKNKVTLKTEKKTPLIHTTCGRVKQKEIEIRKNIEVIIKAVGKKRIEKAFLKATMGPSIKLSVA